MKHYKELLELQCFTRVDVEQITGNADTANSLLTNYKKRGFIESVKRNLYVAISLETMQSLPNRYRIASHITNGAYISHHSALEYYGCANQVFYMVFVSGEKRFAAFEHDDVTYSYIAPRIDAGIVVQHDGVKLTDIERTVLDSINDFERIAGLEEVLRCLELIPHINEDKLFEYLERYNKQFLYQKTGYILSHFKKELRLSDSFFDLCACKVSKSIRYLYYGIKHEKSIFNNQWQLYVPLNLRQSLSQGVELNADI
jgi:predicted transcriptional regulator of viral defense system